VRIDGVTLAIPLLNGIDPPGNSFVVWDRKIVYMSVTKAACTTLRWMIADLAGEDFERFYEAPGAQQSRLMTIHGTRTKWQRTVALSELPADRLAEISVDNGWFVFAVVRDPWSRFWSAWQSKFLVRHTFYEDYQKESWYPSIASSQEQVIKDFRRFLDAKPWTYDPQLSTDVHFLPQVYSVRPHGVNYSRVYDLNNLGELFTDVKSHLEAVGRPVDDLYVPRANETPLPLIPAVLENGAAEVIEELYADDFTEYGDRWSLERLMAGPRRWSDDAIKHAAYHTVANERIGDLSKQTRLYKRKWRSTTLRNRRLRQQLRQLEASASAGPRKSQGGGLGRLARRLRSQVGR
jgi:hypothetical protein